MNEKLLKKFTWGFEIEGRFKKDLVAELLKLEKEKKGFGIELKYDGSVDVEVSSEYWEMGEWSLYTEITIGVFKSFEEMMKVLSMFKNNDNYLENETCGLHIHLGTKDKLLKTRIGDYKFIKNLQEWVSNNLCPRTGDRLYNQYCRQYWDLKTTYMKWRNRKKYCFIRNHDQGTFEFRFFSPCEHKEENLKKFFGYFFSKLEKIKPKKRTKIFLPKAEKQKIKLQFNVEKNFEIKKLCV